MKSIPLIFFLTLGMFAALRAEWFLHRTTAENSDLNFTLLASHLAGKRSDRIFFCPIQRQISAKHPLRSRGLWFPADRQRWSIFNERNSTAIGVNLEFSVYLARANDIVFVHRHVRADNQFRTSIINHPSLNNNPTAFPFLAQNWDQSGIYNPAFINTLEYNSTIHRWVIDAIPDNIFDEFVRIPDGATWNVLVRPAGEQTFRIAATEATEFLVLDHPLLNDNPQALLLVTQEQIEGTFREHFERVQVRYDPAMGRWGLESTGRVAIREEASFLLFVSSQSDVPIPALDFKAVGSRAEVSISTEFGFRYQMETSSDLRNWLNEGLPFSGNGERRFYPTTAALPEAYYRIRRLPE